jgi:hypothetical protein
MFIKQASTIVRSFTVLIINLFSIVDAIGAGGWQHHKMVMEGNCSMYSAIICRSTLDNCLRYWLLSDGAQSIWLDNYT